METTQPTPVASAPSATNPAEERMLRADIVREILARLARGQGVKTIAHDLGVDRKTVKRWRRKGEWRPRQGPHRPSQILSFMPFLERRGPEVGWNGAVLHREVQALGFPGSYLQVHRAIHPLRDRHHGAAVATVRFETPPGQQAQVDFGQTRLWIADVLTTVHVFVFTLGFSRRGWCRAYPHERLSAILEGHEQALRHFGGVPLECLYDNPRTLVLGRHDHHVRWHPVFEDFARYYGLRPGRAGPIVRRRRGKWKAASNM